MNKQLVVAMTTITTVAVIATSCVSTQKTELRKVASSPEVEAIAAQGKNYRFTDQNGARSFTWKDVSKLASASNIKLTAGQILTGNDAAFEKKLELINGAQKSVRMVYFIYAEDDSSSKLNQALIEKARAGVPITLLVDFVTNYKNLDLFSMLESEGKGYLKTFFYNFPGNQLLEDANYTVLPCPQSATPDSDTCYQSKSQTMKRMVNKATPTPFARILLAGMYGKNATALKVALGHGAEIDPKQYKSTKEDAERVETEDVIELAKLTSEALVQNNLISRIKLSLAMMTYGETLNPLVNELTGRLPIRSIEAKPELHGKLWDHITDYTHHKLLAVDRYQFQLGGRNIEDSYHMTKRPEGPKTGKYIFIDTDFWGQTAAGGTSKIEDSFDNLVNTRMVASLQKVKEITAYDFIANTGSANQPGAAEAATHRCVSQQVKDVGACILQTMSAIKDIPGVLDYKSEQDRILAKVAAMKESVRTYETEYIGKKLNKAGSAFGLMSASDLATAQVAYLENVNNVKGKRVLGSKVGYESDNGKNIQAVWYRGLENACKASREDKDSSGNLRYSEKNPLRVIFHTAYLLMPSGMVHKLARMMNNDYGDCSRVRITFITNSPLTTDLGPINMLARYQLSVLFTHYAGLQNYKKRFESNGGPEYKQFFPQMDYYELQASAGNSLHTKVSLIGDDLIIGSANADVRSYYMDTNNAIMIRNAKNLNAQYIKFVDEFLIEGKRVEDKMHDFAGKNFQTLSKENENLLIGFAKRWNQEKRLTEKRMDAVLRNLDKAGTKISEITSRLILFRGDFDRAGIYTGQGDRRQFDEDLNDAANAYDAIFKVF